MIKAAKRVLVFALWAQLIQTSSIEPRISLVDDLYLADEPAHQGQRTHITKLAKFPKMILSASSLGFRFFLNPRWLGSWLWNAQVVVTSLQVGSLE